MAINRAWLKGFPRLVRSILLWTLALGLIAGAAGCHYFQSASVPAEPPDYFKVTAIGVLRPGDDRPFIAFQGALSGVLVCQARAALDAQVADPAQRLLMARAEARRAALRALGQKITAATDKQGRRLADQLKDDPGKQATLNEMLENVAQVTYQEQDQATWAKAQLNGLKALEVLNANPPAAAAKASPAWTPQQAAQHRRLAYDKALREVKAMLREKAMNLELSDKRLVKEALAEDRSATQELDALLFLAQPDEINYLPDGSCEMTIYFDRNRVRELAERKRGGGWFSWLHR
jgi:hypothetical protein